MDVVPPIGKLAGVRCCPPPSLLCASNFGGAVREKEKKKEKERERDLSFGRQLSFRDMKETDVIQGVAACRR